MALNLDELRLSLDRGAQAESNLVGLDERYGRANALRDQPIANVKGNATATGLGAIANLMNSYTGNRRAAGLETERTAALEQMAGAKNALPMYQMQQNENRYQEELLSDKTAIDLAAQNRIEDQDIATSIRAQAQANTLQKATALKKQQDLDRQATLDAAALKAGSMSSSQIRELGAYRKRIDELSPIVNGVSDMNVMLAPYNDPDANIPGVGRIEGGSGTWGGLTRAVGDMTRGDNQGEKIFAKFTQTIAPLIRKQAGLAQTATELKRVEDTYGADWITDEAVFREQWPLIMNELNADLSTLNSTISQETRDFYTEANRRAGTKSIFDTAGEMTSPFAPKKATPAATDFNSMTDEQLEAMAAELTE